jgi:predicted alpha/beta-hydrolase family hydrolase
MGLMQTSVSKRAIIDAGKAGRVSALLNAPGNASACYVFAHGAGAGMSHKFMEAAATGLAERGIATLRYQFAYMEKGGKRPDPPALAHAVVRAAVAYAVQHLPGLSLIAGGKSFGGRMTSQAQAVEPLPSVRGLAFFGFPLHAAGKPSGDRGEHLKQIDIPMLFLQGDKDKLAELSLLKPVVKSLGKRATLCLLPDADHSFHVPARSGRNDADTLATALDAFASWCKPISSSRTRA